MPFSGRNRRKFPRAVFPCLAKIMKDGQAEDYVLTHTENISLGGMCVIISRPLALFSAVGVELDLMDGSSVPLACQGRVVWSKLLDKKDPAAPDSYETGVELDGLTDEAVLRLEAVILKSLRSKD